MKDWDYYSMKDVHYPSMSEYKDKESWRQAKKEWRNVEHERYLEFKQDLFKEFGVEDDPAREIIFRKAWDVGHSSGYHEVYSEFDELMDFVKDVRKGVCND